MRPAFRQKGLPSAAAKAAYSFFILTKTHLGNSLPICIGTGSYKGAYLSRTPRRKAGDYLVLAKMPSRKEIIPNSLRLPYFGACPAELRVRRGGFFFAPRRRAAKSQFGQLPPDMHRDRLLQGGIPVPYAAAHGRGLLSSRKDAKPQSNVGS